MQCSAAHSSNHGQELKCSHVTVMRPNAFPRYPALKLWICSLFAGIMRSHLGLVSMCSSDDGIKCSQNAWISADYENGKLSVFFLLQMRLGSNSLDVYLICFCAKYNWIWFSDQISIAKCVKTIFWCDGGFPLNSCSILVCCSVSGKNQFARSVFLVER